MVNKSNVDEEREQRERKEEKKGRIKVLNLKKETVQTLSAKEQSEIGAGWRFFVSVDSVSFANTCSQCQ